MPFTVMLLTAVVARVGKAVVVYEIEPLLTCSVSVEPPSSRADNRDHAARYAGAIAGHGAIGICLLDVVHSLIPAAILLATCEVEVELFGALDLPLRIWSTPFT